MAFPKSAGPRATVKTLTAEQKREIGDRCDRFIADVLAPRFLRRITRTRWNFPVLLHGKWRGGTYSFIARYCSGWDGNAGEEFDSARGRLDHDDECLTETRFHVMWRRHTGQWFCCYRSMTLDEALRGIETDPVLQPPL